jgi:hypothetical protein
MDFRNSLQYHLQNLLFNWLNHVTNLVQLPKTFTFCLVASCVGARLAFEANSCLGRLVHLVTLESNTPRLSAGSTVPH